jgi:hypothetical protein
MEDGGWALDRPVLDNPVPSVNQSKLEGTDQNNALEKVQP